MANRTNTIEKKKESILLIAGLIISITATCIAIFNYFVDTSDNRLDKHLDEIRKEYVELIHSKATLDSINALRTRTAADSINQYVSNCSLIIDGKMVTLDDLAIALNKVNKENETMRKKIGFYEEQLIDVQNQYANLIDSFQNYKLRQSAIHP